MHRWEGIEGHGECAGAGEKSRTPDLRITNALLYQLSYTGIDRWRSAAGEASILAYPRGIPADPQ